MLVKKQRSQRMVVITGVIIIALILVVYLLYINFWASNIISSDLESLNGSAAVEGNLINSQGLEDLDFVQLKEQTDLDHTEQLSYTASDKENPTAPLDLVIEDPGYGEILDIFWRLPEDGNYSSFRVYRSLDNTKGQEIIGNLVGNHFRDKTVKNSQVYYYTVVSVNKDGKESLGSPKGIGVAHDLFPPSSPTDLSINRAEESNSAVLAWQNPPDADFDYLRIYRSLNQGQVGDLLADRVEGETYTDTGLSNGLTYYYTLTAVDKTGNESSKTLPYVSSGRANPFEIFEF